MSYRVYPTPDFKKFFKKLYKTHPSLKADLQELIDKLSEEPGTGINLGHGVYKIRLAISSKGKGKSGGARVITYLVTEDKEVYLIFIYDKSKLENITKQQVFELLKKAGLIK
ncbi:MAG: type II toxin-antitoxin system RelE/ParE family toxin [Bacteroidales bacterium]|nr:type II toxin-antitoxin system RelE/ParE family toxin [Bacteroidales bacterium]